MSLADQGKRIARELAEETRLSEGTFPVDDGEIIDFVLRNVRVPGAAGAVREAIEKHRDEVVQLVVEHGWKRHPEELADHALDCLLALVEGREWPGGEK